MDSVFDFQHMEEAQVSIVDKLLGYQNSLDEGGPDIGHVFGAPNDYEAQTRFYGAQSDLIHNKEHGNNLDGMTLILPQQVKDAVPSSEIDYLGERGVHIQSPDRELYTTADDWKSARDIASKGDRIHGYTSDYHGLKTHLTGKITMDTFGESDIHTFGFETDRSERQNIAKHNTLAQTLDTPRQIYKMAKSEANY